jgi:chemotaxis protein MotB
MRTLIPRYLLTIALLGACVPFSALQESHRQNSALKQEVSEQDDLADAKEKANAENVADMADKSVALALQNHYLKINNADLRQKGLERDAFYDSVTNHLRDQVKNGRLRITRGHDMLTLDVADEILFDSAKVALKPVGREVLQMIGQAVAKSDKTLRVVGHTDTEPMAPGAEYATNWELSTARATTVVRYFQEQAGLDPRRLLAAGRGEWMPVASNATAAGRQRNRRITITLLDPGWLDGAESGIQTP